MAIRYTKQQKASPYFDAYKKERARLQRFASSAKARGIELPTDFVPKVPQKITEGSVRKLQRITPEHGYYEKATFRAVNKFTGEVIESKRGTATSINRAIAKFKESIRESLEPTEPLSKRRIQQITESFSKPDVFSTARHKSMLKQIEKRATPEELEETLKEIEEKEQETEEIPQPYIEQESTFTDEESLPPSYSTMTKEEIAEAIEEEAWQTMSREELDEYYKSLESEPATTTDSTFTDEGFTVVDDDLDIDSTPFGDSIDIDEQSRKLDDAMNKAIGYVEDEVSSYWAEKLQQALDNIKDEYGSDPAFMALGDDTAFWEYIGDMVQANYGRGVNFPSAVVRGMIEERLTGSPPTMEDNARLNDDQLADSGDSFYI